MFVVALRQNIKDLLVHFNLCLFPSGNGTKSLWISSLAFQKPRKETMLSLLLSIDSQKLLTFFQSASLLLPVSYQTCMSRELYHFMVFLWKSILIVVAFSPLDSGKAFKMLWELISLLVQFSILNLVVKSKGLTKFWKTCSEPVLSHSERIGRSLFHSLSLLITIAYNLV